jgi:hypothetical protein
MESISTAEEFSGIRTGLFQFNFSLQDYLLWGVIAIYP